MAHAFVTSGHLVLILVFVAYKSLNWCDILCEKQEVEILTASLFYQEI